MSFLEEMKPYQDAWGMYHSKRVGEDGKPPTANGLLTTSISIMLGLYNYNAIKMCEMQPGLYRRHPKQDDQEGHDDYIGITAVSGFIAADVWDYGKRHFYIYNNIKPGSIFHPDGRINFSAMLGRHVDFIAHLYYARWARPNLLLRFAWALSMVLTARSESSNQDGRILEWIKIQTYKHSGTKSWICDLAVKYFWKQMGRQGLTMKKLWFNYTQDAEHPFCTYWEDER